MQAIVHDAYGSTDVLELRDVAVPEIAADEVLVRVRAAGVDRGVWHVMTGLPYPIRLAGYGLSAPKNPVLGMDVAGVVEAVGATVTRFQPGDEVFGIGKGTFAEFTRVAENKLALKPTNLTFEQAAAVAISGLTALQGLRDRAHLEAGQKVLIIGASGGVGTYAVQLAKALGAEVTAVCSTTKIDLVRSLGADRVIDYTQQDFTQMGLRYDLVFDIVSQAPFSEVRRALEPEGTFVLVGHDQYGRSGHRVLGSLGRMLPLLGISPFTKQLPGVRPGLPRNENWATIVELLKEGRMRPVVDERVFPLEQAADALDHLATGTAKGRVVLTV